MHRSFFHEVAVAVGLDCLYFLYYVGLVDVASYPSVDSIQQRPVVYPYYEELLDNAAAVVVVVVAVVDCDVRVCLVW